MIRGSLKLLNWNIAGAKYLEQKSVKAGIDPEMSREHFREKLNNALRDLIRRHKPQVITLQEIVTYSDDGDESKAECVIDELENYRRFPVWLIDRQHHSAQGKWRKVRESGGWTEHAFFAQGNAVFVRNDIPTFPIFDLPNPISDLPNCKQEPNAQNEMSEVVKFESGFYFGDRNTEPRAALVAHLVLSELTAPNNLRISLKKPLDVFVVNLHLTTLMGEREGIPGIDEEASQIRLRQLDIVTEGIVSRYNRWRKSKYQIRGEDYQTKTNETTDRHNPIWILAGDFNFTPESIEYETLLRRGFIDLILHHDLGSKTSGLGQDPTLTVDYVFAGPLFVAIDPKDAKERITGNHIELNDETRVSDHFPLIVSVPIELNED